MAFSYKSINTKTPSMAPYSGKVVDFKYQDTKVEDAKLINLNLGEIENVDLNIAADLDPIIDVVTGASATVTVFALSLVEGIGILGEALVDTGATVGTAVRTPFTWAADKVSGLFGVETHYTENMWNTTKAFVSKDFVKNAFDNFYNNNPGGQRLKEDAFAIDTVRSVGNEVGYVTGIVGLTILTGGAGTAGLGSTAGALSMSQGMGLFAGLGGFGKGADNAWSQGASTARGLFTATTSGLWEGFQYYLGGRIAGISVSTTKWINALLRMELDSVLGGTEGIVRPAINSIISGEGFIEEFKANGGIYTVATNLMFSFALSCFGELKLRDFIQFGGFKSKIKGNINPDERKKLLNEFSKLFVPNGYSHKRTIDFFANFFEKTENPEALKVLSAMVDYKKTNNKFNLTSTMDGFYTSFFSPSEKRINIRRSDCDNKLYHVGMHESGHFLHATKRNDEIPFNIESVFDRAKSFNSTKGANSTFDFAIEMTSRYNNAKGEAEAFFDKSIAELGFTRDSYYDDLCKKTKNELLKLSDSSQINIYLKKLDIDENTINSLGLISPNMVNDKFVEDVATYHINSVKSKYINYYMDADFPAISDMLTALYKSNDVVVRGQYLNLPYGHKNVYYKQEPLVLPFKEMIANYTQLKTTGSKRSLGIIRQMFGNELVEVLDDYYQSFFK